MTHKRTKDAPESDSLATFLAQPAFEEDEALEAAAVDHQSREAPIDAAALKVKLLALGRPKGGRA